MRTLQILFLPRHLTPILLTVLIIFGSSCSPRSEPTPGPALWKVEGGSAELYLFGTFHMLPADLEWKNEAIVAAMASSDVLVTEADTSNDEEIGTLIQTYAFNPEGKTLRSYFSQEEADKIDAALVPWGTSIDSSVMLKPWFVSLQVGLTAMVSLGFEPDSGVEEVLFDIAKSNAMSLEYLETGAAGIRALADHPDDLQAKILLAAIDDLGHLEEMTRQMTEAWSRGDISAVASILNASMAKTPGLIEAVLYNRNQNWIAPLTGMLNSDGHYFVAVGAGHLAGNNSLIELLEAEGYKLVRQ